MAAMRVELDISWPPLLFWGQRIRRPVLVLGSAHQFQVTGPEIGVFESLGSSALKVQLTRRSSWVGQEILLPEEVLELSWKHLIADSTQWWDIRRRKTVSQHPDCRQAETKVPLWLNSVLKLDGVDFSLARADSSAADIGLKTILEAQLTSVHGPRSFAASEGHLNTQMCKRLSENGLVSDAVDALDLLVQRKCSVSNYLFYRVLKRCVEEKDLDLGRHVHALTVKSGYDGDAFLATHLIGLYASHGRLEEAKGVFTKVATPDAYNWASIICAYARHGGELQAAEAVRLYRQMCALNTVEPDDRIYAAALKACAAARDLVAGKEVHAHILAGSRKPDIYVQAGLVNMYAKCGSLDDARRLFDKLSGKNVITWTAMIAGYAQQGMGQEALSLYSSMRQEGSIPPDSVTYVCLLQACASVGSGALEAGKQLHAEIGERGLQQNVVLGGSLVNMYAKCGSVDDARRVFDKLPVRSIVAWNALIAGYAQQGMGYEALNLYNCMQKAGLTPDSVTYVCLLQACGTVGVGALSEGKQLHALLEEQGLQEGLVVGGSLVNMYAKCGNLDRARRLFDKLPSRNVLAWNAMIAGYVHQGMCQEALGVYSWMEQEGLTLPDSVTYVSLLQACANLGVGALEKGKQLHAQIRETGLGKDVVLGGSLVNMYAKCGSLEEAEAVFDKLPKKDVVTWTALIAGYGKQGMGQEALKLYKSMQQEGLNPPDSVTYVCLLQACATVGVAVFEEAKQLHAQIRAAGLERNSLVGGSLVNMYAKCGRLEEARHMFDRLSDRDVVTWTAMIAGYAQQGMGKEALSLYMSMQQDGFTDPDAVTYVCLLQACAAVAALPLGVQLHAEIEDRNMQVDSSVGAALVNMYAKCGSMHNSQHVFDSMPERSVEAWDALVGGYTRQGNSQAVFDLLDRMRLEGPDPTEITFLNILTVCSHVGLVNEGREYFEAMRKEFDISATMEHFVCMVDLLGRAGHLDEALQMVRTMPFPPNAVVWRTLLGACRNWRNVQIGQQAFKGGVNVDERDAALYVMMADIYAGAHMWEAAKEMQTRRLKLEAWKRPGQSWWTDMSGVVHTFISGHNKHTESEDICAGLICSSHK